MSGVAGEPPPAHEGGLRRTRGFCPRHTWSVSGMCGGDKTYRDRFCRRQKRKETKTMNTEKWQTGNLGLLGEADRTMYKDKDTVSKSCIDRTRTHLNYNLCPHPQYTAAQVKDINRKIRGKELAKNAIAWGGTVVSQPKDYTGSTEDFMRTAYEGLKKMYKLKDEDIISAYVHMDETTPHMHFYFIPVVHEETKDRINWDGVMPRKMYKTQHKRLQAYMTNQLGTPVNLINGKTKGVDMTRMTAEEKRLSMALDNLNKQIETRKEEIKDAGDKLLAEIDGMVKAHNGLKRALNVSWKLSEDTKDKITIVMDKTDMRAQKALEQPLDDVDAILAAALAAERATRTYSKLKSVAKGDLDIDELLADDDFELC